MDKKKAVPVTAKKPVLKKAPVKKISEAQRIKNLLSQNASTRIDLGCGENKMPGAIGVDFRKVTGVDIVQNLALYPWSNLPDKCADVVITSHLLEHINPDSPDPRLAALIDLLIAKKAITPKEVSDTIGDYSFLGGFVRFMDEVWRITKPGGQFISTFPYAGSPGYWQDPTHCLKQGSEILSRDGFKKITDIKIGEEVLTKNLESGKSEWGKVVNVIVQDYKGPMIRFSHQRMDISVTPNHDMVWGTWASGNLYKSRADKFPLSGRIGFSSIPDWDDEKREAGAIAIPSVSHHRGDRHMFDGKDFMSLLGWILSEGSFSERGKQKYVHIFQSSSVNKDKYNEIEALIKRMGFKYYAYDRRFDIISENLYEALKKVGKQDKRFIPTGYKNEVETSLLRPLLESLLAGDGEEMFNSDGHIYTTISKQLADDVQEIAVKCGFRASVILRPGKQFISVNGKTYTRKDQYRVSITTDNPLGYPKPLVEQYNGKIECVTVDRNNTIFVRQNGYTLWTGNCNPISHVTMTYFDPLAKDQAGNFYHLYTIYRPKPWKILRCFYDVNGFIEIAMERREIDPSYRTLDKGLEDKSIK